MLKHLDVLNVATDTEAAKSDDNGNPEAAVVEMAEKDDAPTTEKKPERPSTVSVVSRDQALLLLKPRRAKGKKPRVTPSQSKDTLLEGKFVNVVDLLLPRPAKGEFDVNKIKSSLYFFS
jgi:DNA-directed RNA polymerase